MSKTKRLNYALDIYGNKYFEYYFESNRKLKSEIKYQKILEKEIGYNVYLNPKATKNNIRTADYWFEETNELWDLKEINGNGKKTIDTIFKDAKNQTENLILKPEKTTFSLKEIIKYIDLFYNNNYRKHIKKVILLNHNNKIIVLYTRR